MSQQQYQHEVMDELRQLEEERDKWLNDAEVQAEYLEYLNSKEQQNEMD